MTDQIDQDVDRRTEQVLIAYLRQELSAPATAIMGYAEMLMGIDDLQRVLDASRSSPWPNIQLARSSGD